MGDRKVASKRCEASLFSNFRGYPCGRTAKFERDGKYYCGTHDPAKVSARRAERDARWAEEDRARRVMWDAALLRRKGEAYDRVMEIARRNSLTTEQDAALDAIEREVNGK